MKQLHRKVGLTLLAAALAGTFGMTWSRALETPLAWSWSDCGRDTATTASNRRYTKR